MDQSDYRIAASLCPPAARGDNGAAGSSASASETAGPRVPAARSHSARYRYAADGTRLKGAQAELAALLNDQERYATSPEALNFFHAHVLCEAAVGSGVATGALPGTAGRRPDMFGLTHSPLEPRAGAAAAGINAFWETETLKEKDVNASVQPARRWSLVRAEAAAAAATDGAGSSSTATGLPFRWRRADEQWEVEGLLDAATAAAPRAEDRLSSTPDDVRASIVPLAQTANAFGFLAACAVAESERKVVAGASHHAGPSKTAAAAAMRLSGILRGRTATSLDYFTFTQEEYEQLPAAATAGDASSTVNFVFDAASARKLFALLARFGSVVVVADRWRSAGRDGSHAAPASSSATASTLSAASPSVEEICAEYVRVTQGVMRQRARRLEAALTGASRQPAVAKRSREAPDDGHDDAAAAARGRHVRTRRPSPRSTAAVSPPRPSEAASQVSAVTAVQHSPYVTLLQRHPLLLPADTAARTLDSSTSAKRRMATDVDASAPAQGAAACFRRLITPSLGVQTDPPPPPTLAAHDGGSTQTQTQASLTSCYPLSRERERRAELRALLARESAVNVAYQRLSAQYLALAPTVGGVLQKLQSLLACPPATPDSPRAHELLAALRTVDAPVASKSTEEERPFRVTLRALPAVDPALWRAAAARMQQLLREPPPSAGSASAGSVAALVEEVFDCVPLHCARLLRAAQAGWMLPPPPPFSHTRTGSPSSRSASSRGHDDASAIADRAAPSASDGDGAHDGDGSDGNDEEEENEDGRHLRAEQQRLQKCVAGSGGVCNRCVSTLSEAVLLTLPHAVPRLHREVEQELEKYLWDDAHALMECSPVVVGTLAPAVRTLYTQNTLLRRFLVKAENLLDTLRKWETATQDAVLGAPSAGDSKLPPAASADG